MMKFMTVFLWGTVCLAYPNAGDHIGLSSEVGNNGILTIEYFNRGFNSLKNVWNVDFKSTFNGAVQSQGSQEFLAEDMVTSAGMQSLLSRCTEFGLPEQITVKAGTFQTCHVISADGNETWFADVPFGIAALTTDTRGMKYKFELTILELGGK